MSVKWSSWRGDGTWRFCGQVPYDLHTTTCIERERFQSRFSLSVSGGYQFRPWMYPINIGSKATENQQKDIWKRLNSLEESVRLLVEEILISA